MSKIDNYVNGQKYPYITVTSGISGYFAVMIWWNPDPGFEEPYSTGIGRYKDRKQAINEAISWAKDEGCPIVGSAS